MILDVVFSEDNKTIDADFDTKLNVSGGFDEGYAEGYTKGKEDGCTFYNDYWDKLQENGTKTVYVGTFKGEFWDDKTFKPKHDIEPTSINSMLMQSKVTDINKNLQECETKIDLSTGSLTDVAAFMSRANSVSCPSPINVENVPSNLGSMFYFNSAIQEVHFIGVKEWHTWNSTFLNAYGIRHLTIGGVIGTRFEIYQSSQLTNESAQSIINALKDLTGETTQSVLLHKTVKANLTDEQIAQITDKNWTLA